MSPVLAILVFVVIMAVIAGATWLIDAPLGWIGRKATDGVVNRSRRPTEDAERARIAERFAADDASGEGP